MTSGGGEAVPTFQVTKHNLQNTEKKKKHQQDTFDMELQNLGVHWDITTPVLTASLPIKLEIMQKAVS